jgi:hypothetical protein
MRLDSTQEAAPRADRGGLGYLPQPPDDAERDLYLGPQHR